MTSRVEPGQPLEIEYGNGRKLTTKSLNLRQKARVMEIMQETSNSPRAFHLLCSAIEICCPDLPESEWDKLDAESASEIIVKVLANNNLDGDALKKFE